MGDRVWTCDECGKRGMWDRKRWRHVFLGGPCAVFCSDDCCERWSDRPPHPSRLPLANYTPDGALVAGAAMLPGSKP